MVTRMCLPDTCGDWWRLTHQGFPNWYKVSSWFRALLLCVFLGWCSFNWPESVSRIYGGLPPWVSPEIVIGILIFCIKQGTLYRWREGSRDLWGEFSIWGRLLCARFGNRCFPERWRLPE